MPLKINREKQQKKKEIFECHLCLKVFTRKHRLSIHSYQQHNPDAIKEFLCSYPNCGSRFTEDGNLRAHEKKHTGAAPF